MMDPDRYAQPYFGADLGKRLRACAAGAIKEAVEPEFTGHSLSA